MSRLAAASNAVQPEASFPHAADSVGRSSHSSNSNHTGGSAELSRLTDAIAQRVGPQRYAVWFSNSTKFDLRNDQLEINVPNDFIGDWIGTHFAGSIQEATHEVFGSALPVKFNVVPQLFEQGAFAGGPAGTAKPQATAAIGATPVRRTPSLSNGAIGNGPADAIAGMGRTPGSSMPGARFDRSSGAAAMPANAVIPQPGGPIYGDPQSTGYATGRLKHDLNTYVVGTSNQLAHSTAGYVCEFPGGQYNPLFIHGNCGLGKTHLLQGLCRKFAQMHPTKKWMYLTGEEFTNEYVLALRHNKIDAFRRKMRDLDLLVIDDVHFLGGKRATQEEFLHTFNAIEATGKQVVMASDAHPKQIEEFGESLINRFISGMVVRVDPPNYAMRCEILRGMAKRQNVALADDVVDWIAKRVTQNIRELEGALTRVRALAAINRGAPTLDTVVEALSDLDRQMVAPLKPDNILVSVCQYFGLDDKELMSGRRQRTISLARSVAMYLVRKNSRLSFPEIAGKLGKRNHSTVISACRRIEKAVAKNEQLTWESSVGDRCDEAQELIQRLEEAARAMG